MKERKRAEHSRPALSRYPAFAHFAHLPAERLCSEQSDQWILNGVQDRKSGTINHQNFSKFRDTRLLIITTGMTLVRLRENTCVVPNRAISCSPAGLAHRHADASVVLSEQGEQSDQSEILDRPCVVRGSAFCAFVHVMRIHRVWQSCAIQACGKGFARPSHIVQDSAHFAHFQ